MNQANVKVSFYLKKSEADIDGNCPVMAKLSVGKYSEAAFSVKMKVSQSRWTSGRASGKSVAKGDKQPSGRDSCDGFKYLLRTVGCT